MSGRVSQLLCDIIVLVAVITVIIAGVVGVVFTTVAFLHIPPSLPSLALQSFTPLPLPPPNATADDNTITARDWQVSFFLRNTNTKSRRSPAKHGPVLYDHISARLLLDGAGQDPDHDVIASVRLPLGSYLPFDQRASQGSVVNLRFPGNQSRP